VARGIWCRDAPGDGRGKCSQLGCADSDEGLASHVQGVFPSFRGCVQGLHDLQFFNETGYNVDIATVREMHPDMKDWKTFLRTDAPKSA
jgi:hypothetical protein